MGPLPLRFCPMLSKCRSPILAPTEEGTLMGSLPLPVLIGVVSLLAIGTLYFVWVRKLPKK